MNNMKKWVRGALCVGAVAGSAFLMNQLLSEKPVGASGRAQTVQIAGAGTAPVNGASDLLSPDNPWLASSPSGGMAAVSPLSTMSPARFAADTQGKLVLNGDTHANLEKLLIEENPAALQAKLDQAAQSLPAQAAADLKVLVAQFQQYSKALSHSISPENAPENEQDGLKLLDSLHTLRVSYLGAETAKALFGADEATTRQLIALMGADKDPNRTQQEKAERAQEVISKKSQTPPAS
jgi:hypothetical protein